MTGLHVIVVAMLMLITVEHMMLVITMKMEQKNVVLINDPNYHCQNISEILYTDKIISFYHGLKEAADR